MTVNRSESVWKNGLRPWLLAALFLIPACSAEKEKKRFSKLTSAETGINFTNRNDETDELNIFAYEYFYNGGGIAAGDINNDGLTDLYFSSNTGENKLYLNEGDFNFKDITASSGTATPIGWKTGVSMVDLNNDGYLDIFVCRSGPGQLNERTNLVYINNGDLTFTEISWKLGLRDASYSTQAAFFDFDRDGDLDLFLLNHSLLQISNSFDISQRNTTTRFPYVGNSIFRNDDGKFIDISDSIGIYGPASNYGLGVSFSDVNNDGWPDIYTGCDYTGRDRLLFNQQGRFFLDVTDSLLTQISKFSMGTDIADINNDGWMDIFSLDMLPEDNYRQKQLMGADRFDQYMAMARNGLHYQSMRNMLHLNNGGGKFSEIAQLAGVSNTDWSWASLFADYDNDGIQDLFITNGFKRDLTNNDFSKFQAFEEFKQARQQGRKISVGDVIEKLPENKIPNYMYRGLDGLIFENVTSDWGLDDPSLSNGAVYVDLDNDGDLDLVVNNVNGEAGVYRNNNELFNKHHFLRVRLTGSELNKGAIGAKVSVYSGERIWVREMFPVRGFQSSVDPVLHVGLGNASSIDSLHIRWPDGTFQRLGQVKTNQLLEVAYKPTDTHSADGKNETLFRQTQLPIHFVHHENEFVDFRVQPLLPRMYSREGPAFASADVNGDGQPDYYFGGAKNISGVLYLSSNTGYRESNHNLFEQHKESEDVDAAFVDVDNDGDLDLYVVSGGYEFDSSSPALSDRLYINQGNGTYEKGTLPGFLTSGACVRPADFDQDGDTDLFVGGRIVPGRFPEIPRSVLLLNDGSGSFSFSGDTLLNVGHITDAVWLDFNKDSYPELVVSGEWMPLTVFRNDKGTLTVATREFFDHDATGFWTSMLHHDFDGDGDEDLMVGNYGLNSPFRASVAEPVGLVYDDFDNNGSPDPIISYFIQQQDYPFATRDELTEQLPTFKKRFTNYHTYSSAVIQEVLTTEEWTTSKKIEVNTLESCWFRNDNGKLMKQTLPVAIQMAPVYGLALMDVNGDGIMDVIAGGNASENRARLGRMSASPGMVLLSDGKGGFDSMSPIASGINIHDDIRNISVNGNQVMFILNNAAPQLYTLNAEFFNE